jgi:hypothetical protein
MGGNEFIWLASIVLGITVLGWLILDWLESAHQWDKYEPDPKTTDIPHLGRSEQQIHDALDGELELMLGYPLDPFAPALLWRPLPQDEWIEMQEGTSESLTPESLREPTPDLRPGESS